MSNFLHIFAIFVLIEPFGMLIDIKACDCDCKTASAKYNFANYYNHILLHLLQISLQPIVVSTYSTTWAKWLDIILSYYHTGL